MGRLGSGFLHEKGRMIMAQYIKITGKAANARIEKAIPKLRAEGMGLDQATAVAIRLESKGKLTSAGAPKPRTKPRKARAGALAALAVFKPRKKKPTSIPSRAVIKRPKTTKKRRRITKRK